MSNTVAVQDLCVGMFVHLDLGWMRHPFPLSSFRIASPDQIDIIRGLGLTELRWVPEKSVLATDVEPVDEGPPSDLPPETPAEAEARERRDQLTAQREASRLCEGQYQEASLALRDSFANVLAKPVPAREDAEALTQALVTKMLGRGELCIRLLSSSAGDRAAAHGMNVAVISLLMGRAMCMEERDMLDLGMGAMLHDVGKVELAERVRHADERFSADDMEAYQSHVPRGVEIGRRMGLSDPVLAVLAQHHEFVDGSGFPGRLVAERMTTASRIVSIVNRYDNLCNPSVLARAITPHEALSLLFAQNRAKFDAPLLNTFIRMMGVYPAGSIVQLTDDRYAMVVSVNSTRPLKPRVLVHDPKVRRDEALLVDLESVPNLGIRRSLNPSKLPTPALDYLAPRPRVSYYFEAVAPPERESP